MDNFLLNLGFIESKPDSNLYFKVEGERPVILLLYVDDLFLIGEGELISYAKRRLPVTTVQNVPIHRVQMQMKDGGLLQRK